MVIKKKKENRIIKWLRVKENRNLLANIFLLGFFTVYLFLFIILCSFLPIFPTIILKSFIEYSPIPQGLSYAAIILYILGILPIYGLFKVIIKIIEKSKLRNIIPSYIPLTLKKFNFYFILSILMIYVIITVGLNIYQSYYKNDLPFTFDFNNNYNLTISSNCQSEGGLSMFTVGDGVNCNLNINSKSECDLRLDELIVNDNNETLFNHSSMNMLIERGFYKHEGTIVNTSFPYKISSSDLHSFVVSLKFNYGLCENPEPSLLLIHNIEFIRKEIHACNKRNV